MFNSRIEKTASAMTDKLNLDDIRVIAVNGNVGRDYMNRITLNDSLYMRSLPVWDIDRKTVNLYIERRMVEFVIPGSKEAKDLIEVAKMCNNDKYARAVILHDGKLVCVSDGKTDILPCIINI